jgi:hypothetical protein
MLLALAVAYNHEAVVNLLLAADQVDPNCKESKHGLTPLHYAAEHGQEKIVRMLFIAIPFETFGMDKVVERYTDWPLWAHFGTVVQHQNLDGVEEVLQGIGFGDARCRLNAFEGQNDLTDILVLASPRYGGARTDVTLYFGGQGQRGACPPISWPICSTAHSLTLRCCPPLQDPASSFCPTSHSRYRRRCKYPTGPRHYQQPCGRD